MTRTRFHALIEQRLIQLDGATGTELVKRGMPAGVCPEAWVLEHPEALAAVQQAYAASGSDLVYAPTFGGNPLKLAEFHLEQQTGEINRQLAEISRRAVPGKLVFGDIAPTGQLVEPFGPLPFEKTVELYKEQVRGLIDGGVDGFAIETMMDLQEARAALIAVRELSDLPAIVTLTFEPGGRTLTGVHPVSALVTLQAELGKDKKLETTRDRGAQVWNELLNRIVVEGGTDEQIRTFYCCLFRANLFSRKFYERKENGEPYYYSPYNGKVYDGYMYTDNGFWDTFRSQFPLTNILHPTMQGRYMNALLDAQEQGGWLPSWSAPGETGGMLGNHAISLLADAWAKGIRTFDPERALKAYAHEAMNKGPYGGANGRGFWKEYYQLGYVPYPESLGSSSQTMEYAYDDFCGYMLARMTGHEEYARMFARQMYNYKNVFDPAVGLMRGKGMDGKWQEPFDPLEWGGPFCEGNAWHYSWSVFHDVQGLIDLYGSDEKFTTKMDSVFILPSVIKPGTYGGVIHEMKEMELAGMGQYAHGNQPIQHMPYLYSYAGQPWKTQYWVRQIVQRLYNPTEKGFPGDEDQGGMSSWYVLSALGIYAVCPGTDEYVIGSPLFQKATITLENGNKFVIEAKGNAPENYYIQSGMLNGRVLDKNYIHYSDIVDGGTLTFEMGPKPNLQRNTSKYAAPFSLSKKP